MNLSSSPAFGTLAPHLRVAPIEGLRDNSAPRASVSRGMIEGLRRVCMPSRATIYDVATRAGVSISTVSLALNAPTRVKPQTLERVLAAADELSFVPKTEAVSRARRGVGRIGVIAPFTSY